jgi:hypothetical protein
MKNYSFDNIIKEKALGHEAPVPADAWNNIKNKKKKKRYGFFWWMFVLLIVAGLGTFGIYESTNKDKGDRSLADNKGNATGIKTNNASGTDKNSSGSSTSTTADSITGNDKIVKDFAVTPQQDKQENKTVTVTAVNSDLVTEVIRSAARKNVNINKEKIQQPIKKNAYTVTGKKVNDKLKNDDNTIAVQDVNTSLVNNNLKLKKGKKKYPVGKNNDQPGDETWTNVKSKQRSAARTKINVQAPDVADTDENNTLDKDEVAVITSQENGKAIVTITVPDTKKDSVTSTVKNKVPATDTNVIAISKPAVPKKAKKNKLFIDISTTPFIAVQQNAKLLSIKRTTTTPLTKAEFTADDISSRVNPSFSYTLAVRKQLNKQLFLSTGIQYSKLKESIHLSGNEINTTYAVVKRLNGSGSALIDDTVATVTNGTRIINATNSYDFISIPISAQYTLWENKLWSLSVNGGVYLNIKTIYKNSIKGELVPQYASGASATQKKNTMTTDIFAGIRLARTISSKWQLYAAPTFQVNFMRYNMPEMINYKFIHRAGITIGLSYQLNY